MSRLLFSTIEVTRQVFYRNTLSYAIVNLKPIVPGHVLVIPTRPVHRLGDLTPPELSSLMLSVQQVGKVIERVYGADGLTIACQDGKAAGQSVPHVHFHLLPRKLHGDRFANNDDIYPALESVEGSLRHDIRDARTKIAESSPERTEAADLQRLKVDADDDRKPRTMEDMEKEAQWLKTFFNAESTTSDSN
ncbi:Bis(5'-nucleosyl)-tetraphosphatase [asymmetrical] [Sparassis crispa]|uniref:Bis(5'-nucleosyl)-tetraphosphatase [asymmetrical] n=1 Tax=Sparassis crispa TaxID=139825 RepID=A0A401G656_9APHY|nr:Bis(5'-nucleosyl)-tetraphosphatase [asymmetrical] [Sparassis crispa]GBE77645.1 Bis(5'-nucleosyl)-tetraphosphatase [asymmetrical] [Sparassis crispa]